MAAVRVDYRQGRGATIPTPVTRTMEVRLLCAGQMIIIQISPFRQHHAEYNHMDDTQPRATGENKAENIVKNMWKLSSQVFSILLFLYTVSTYSLTVYNKQQPKTTTFNIIMSPWCRNIKR